MEAAFISAAKDLVRDGASAITSNCGFSIKYQKAMIRALPVPVSMSSLLLLPSLLTMIDGRVGIVSFDSRPLTSDLLKLAGLESQDRVAVAGIENSETWAAIMSDSDGQCTGSEASNKNGVDQGLTRDVLAAVEDLRKRNEDINVLLFECAGFPAVAQHVREKSGLAVYDAVTNASLLMAGRHSTAFRPCSKARA